MPKKQNKSRKPKKRDDGKWTIAIIAVLTVIIGIYLLARYTERIFPPVVKQKIAATKTRTVSLYFSDEKGIKLAIEKRDIKKGAVADEIKDVIDELIKGSSEGLTSTIPDGTRLLNLITKEGVLSIDFSEEISSKHPGGSSAEIQTIYSIVNTITFNFPEIKKVQILINSKKAKTLAGHIDISFPLSADTKK